MPALEHGMAVTNTISSVRKLLEEVFESSILEADFTDLTSDLTKLYASFSGQGFECSFEEILMLTLSESKRSNDVQKIFRFISDFLISLDNKYKSNQVKNSQIATDTEEEENASAIHPLLQFVYDKLHAWSEAASYVVRFRSCQLLYMILTNVLDNGVGEIDVITYEKISCLIQLRRKDVSANVRANAVLLAKFFQDPSDHTDPVINGLCWQLEHDPNSRVRQNIIDILAACEETILPITRRFLHDQNALVRNAALMHICHRISPLSYTAAHRILILNKCFTDTSAVVHQNAENKLVPMWFRAYGDNLCNFFQSLRVGDECFDKLPFAKDLLHILYKMVKISQILEEINLDLEIGLPKSLNGEKIFIWRHFYTMASRQEKLKKFIPRPDTLAEFIKKSFKESIFEDNKASTYNELISFTMDVLDITEDEACEQLPLLAFDLLKNVFIPREVIPYAVGFYCECATKDTKEIHEDLLTVIRDLMKFSELSSGDEQEPKSFILRCLDIFAETLSQDNISGNVEIISLKDELILPNFNSEDNDIKTQAFRALCLYCLLDIEEAKMFWPYIEKVIYESLSSQKENALKGAFDVLKGHGPKLFEQEDTSKKFEEVLMELLSYVEDQPVDMVNVFKGMFKLYLSHHTYFPVVMGRLILFMFQPDEGLKVKTIVTNFLQIYGETKEEAECLTKAFLIIITILFNSSKNSPIHKISIKSVVNQLIEFAKLYEGNKNFNTQEKFQDMLIVLLTSKFLKKPWRLPALDLQDICTNIIPSDIQTLMKLEKNIKLIIESYNSAIFQQTNPFSKRSIKFFNTYLKKLQASIDNSQSVREDSQKSNTSLGNSFLNNINIGQVSPEAGSLNQEVSF